MLGDVGDMVARLRRVLPARWFADLAPLTDAVLSGIGSAHTAIYDLIQNVRLQARLATAEGVFLDFISTDFFGSTFLRRAGESDLSFRLRLSDEVLRPRGTRSALIAALTDLTGRTPTVFEPTRPADTGSYNLGGAGYGVAGAWGNLSLNYQSFVVARRPNGGGIALLAGYGTGGALSYGNLAAVATPVTDEDIFATAAAIMPVGYTIWVQIQS